MTIMINGVQGGPRFGPRPAPRVVDLGQIREDVINGYTTANYSDTKDIDCYDACVTGISNLGSGFAWLSPGLSIRSTTPNTDTYNKTAVFTGITFISSIACSNGIAIYYGDGVSYCVSGESIFAQGCKNNIYFGYLRGPAPGDSTAAISSYGSTLMINDFHIDGGTNGIFSETTNTLWLQGIGIENVTGYALIAEPITNVYVERPAASGYSGATGDVFFAVTNSAAAWPNNEAGINDGLGSFITRHD